MKKSCLTTQLFRLNGDCGYLFRICDKDEVVFSFTIFDTLVPLFLHLIIENGLNISPKIIVEDGIIVFYDDDSDLMLRMDIKPGRTEDFLPEKSAVLEDIETFLNFLSAIKEFNDD